MGRLTEMHLRKCLRLDEESAGCHGDDNFIDSFSFWLLINYLYSLITDRDDDVKSSL